MKYLLLTLLLLLGVGCDQSTESSRSNVYTLQGDVAIDSALGLMWQNSQIYHSKQAEAISHCENLTFAGYSDWRLPTQEELSRFHKEMNAQGDTPQQAFDKCLADIGSDGYVWTKKGADNNNKIPGDPVNFSGAANVRGVRTLQ